MVEEAVLHAKPGYSLHAVYKNPTSKNSSIFVYDGGRLKSIVPTNSETRRMYRPTMPPSFYDVEKFGKISLDRAMPEGKWGCNSSPYIQAVWKTVYDRRGASFEDIFRSLVSEYRIVPLNRRSHKMVEGLVKWMFEPGGPSYLINVMGKFHAGVTPDLDAPLLDQHPNYNPIEWETYNFVRERGMVSYSELKDYIFSGLKWLTKEDYFRKGIVGKMLKAGNLVEVAKSTYRAEKAFEPF